jgi:dTDP-4-amino-4,6-dideoxygalactose transaminase
MTSEHPIPVSAVRLGSEVEELVLQVIRSGSIAQGPMVKRLEDEFASMIGAHHVVAVNNGTTALVAALQVLDLRPGDEVITSPFTFVATINAALAAGATVRFADISVDDFNVTAETIAPLIGPNTRVLMPVHLYGQCAAMDGIADLAERHDVRLVEDAAQAHGATFGGKSAGTWGIGCFSLYATKNLTSGEGGLISTDDDVIDDRLRVLRNQGMRQRYQYEMAGNNYRLTDLHAAVCIPQLATYADQLVRRRANAARLSDCLGDLPGLVVPAELPGREHVWHQYTVRFTEDSPISRDTAIERLQEAGVITGIYYPKLVFDYDCYRTNPAVQLDPVPVAEQVVRECLSLPVHHHLSDQQVDTVIRAVRGLYGR